ncbi:MAG: DUF3099 domain-containing protein [Mycobacteriales bacterium]
MRRHRIPVTLVTSARRSRIDEIDARRRRYMITMGTRTILFVLAVFLFHGVTRWIAIGASMILPYIAVILANAGPSPGEGAPEYVQHEQRPALDAGGSALANEPDAPDEPAG